MIAPKSIAIHQNQMAKINVQSANIRYTDDLIEADYQYDNVKCVHDPKNDSIKVSIRLIVFSLYCVKFNGH